MAPPHYETIIDSESSVGEGITYLSDDERMPVLTVVEMSSVTYTDFVSSVNMRME